MTAKNYTEVTIAGRTFMLGGYEDDEYLQRIATHINGKIGALKEVNGYSRMNADYQTMMLELNLVDDYFEQKKRCEVLEARIEAMEKEIYELKHELVLDQIRREKEQNGDI